MQVNRTQRLVLAFFALIWLGLAVILSLDPDIFRRALKAQSVHGAVAFFAALSVLIGLLSVGVVRRWRWLFWLIAIAFVMGFLRVPAAVLELTGTIPSDSPSWYILLQAVIGVIQLVIGVLMLSGWRRSGAWGAF